MIDFFGLPDPRDKTYSMLKSTEWPPAAEAREFVCALWKQTEQYLDENVQKRAGIQFQQAFWEMYLCAALIELGLPVTPRTSRRCRNEGPDVQVGNVDAWFEAIAVTPGSGVDAVDEPELGVVRSVPHDAIKLRLTSAIAEKRRKFEKYCKRKLVLPDEPHVIAVNAALVPSARRELDVPRIVAAVFPFGWPTVDIDVSSGEVVDSYYTHQPQVVKRSGASVPTDTFESNHLSPVSAVLYSAVDPLNCPASIGADFVLVHNPHATTPLRRGWIPRGREYWKEGEHLKCTTYEGTGA